jgi:hypothetical protein
VNAPSREDLERALRYTQENIRLGDEAPDDRERHGRYQQAAQALSSAGRIMTGLAAAIAPPLYSGAPGGCPWPMVALPGARRASRAPPSVDVPGR